MLQRHRATDATAVELRTWLTQHPEDRRGSRGSMRKSNRTDNESAKMATSAGVVQGYTGVAAVDSAHQIIVHARAHDSGPRCLPIRACGNGIPASRRRRDTKRCRRCCTTNLHRRDRPHRTSRPLISTTIQARTPVSVRPARFCAAPGDRPRQRVACAKHFAGRRGRVVRARSARSACHGGTPPPCAACRSSVRHTRRRGTRQPCACGLMHRKDVRNMGDASPRSNRCSRICDTTSGSIASRSAAARKSMGSGSCSASCTTSRNSRTRGTLPECCEHTVRRHAAVMNPYASRRK
jgi:hypothetical protein